MYKKSAALIATVLAASILTSCGGTDTAEMTSAESTVSEKTAATVSETDTMSAESEETTAETVNDSEVGDPYDVEEIPDETFVWEAESGDFVETEETYPAPPTPPDMPETVAYHGRFNEVEKMGSFDDFENAFCMAVVDYPVSNDDCGLAFLKSKEEAAVERIAYVGTDSRGDYTTLGVYRKYDDEFADDPMVGENYWDYKNHLLAVGGEAVLPYFPAGTAVPSDIVLFPDAGEFYYYGAATKEEYMNSEWHWTISTDLGLTWKPDSGSSTVGNFYHGSDPVYYEHGIWNCGNTEIWIS
ncbi:MAG: hypothetical protein NC452_11270 [Eubacterium sp.]|nr:hypothetical protein [Eubacterium sp.]